MKKPFVTIFLLCFVNLLSQNSGFKFVFDYGFMDLSVPYKVLTEDDYVLERKKLGIRTITKLYEGKSLDSLYRADENYFHKLLASESVMHSRMSYREIYNYDRDGLLMSFHVYPVCNFLSREDSLVMDNFMINTEYKDDSVITYKYYRGKLNQKAVYRKGKLVSDASYYQSVENLPDTIPGKYVSGKQTNESLTNTYTYDSLGRLNYKVCANSRTLFNDSIFYSYSDLHTVLITKKAYEESDKKYELYQQVTVFNRRNQLVRSTFFSRSSPDFREIYRIKRDAKGNTVSITNERDYWGKKSESIVQVYRNTYSGKKLIKSVVHYNFNVVENDTEYNFSENGLLNFIQFKASGYKVNFNYQFYE